MGINNVLVICQETPDSKLGLQWCHELIEDLLACSLAKGGPKSLYMSSDNPL